MDQFRRRPPAEESFGRLERALSGLTLYRKDSISTASTGADGGIAGENEDFKGPLGLNLLHTVSEPLIDFIFIHGLGGGSRKTWSKTADPYHYWPKEWISRDPEFSCARVHSFGYKADWAERKPSFLNIHDYALALLGEIQCNPDIRRSNTKIVLVAHSMGGIAYILAREDPALKEIASRFHTLYFLATPHRGADLAKTLQNILRVSYGQKPMVGELERNSDSIQSINDSFRYFADDLQLWSFYETLPCSLTFTDVTIVDKASATLGLSKERCSLLNADHRGVCKFESPTDTNYKILRNAFITTVDSILTEGMSPLVSQKVSDTTKTEYSNLISLTGVSEAPIDDHLASDEVRVPGSCEWLNLKKGYTTWKSASSSNRPIFWLTGDAGCGKSILSSYVINDLDDSNIKCSYFYFKQGNASKSTITGCLLSLAFQMAHSDETILRRISKLSGGSDTWEQLDERTLWRKVFLGSIFKEPNPKQIYWVIDALDECRRFSTLVSLLAKAPPYLRIFLTSRNTPEVYQGLASHGAAIENYSIQEPDTLADLRIYIDSRTHFLPAGDDGNQEGLRAKILERANGSFLWTSLVVRELEGVYSEEAAEEVLNEVPADMNDLYAQMLKSIPPKGLKLAQSVFIWTLLANRPLSLEELKSTIKSDTSETIHNLAQVIMAICGQLIRVNQNGQVQCVHQTAKMFLLHQEVVPSLVIVKSKAHSRIAELCLRSLNMHFGKRLGRKAKAPVTSVASEADIADYAALYFSDHLHKCASEDSKLWTLLAEFLENNALAWIEYLAQTGRLQHLTRTAKNLKSYLVRRLKHIQPFSNEEESLEAWIQDLIRLNAKFRTALTSCPSAIHHVVPALCPSESVISRAYASRPRGIIVKGLTETSWDECLVRIEYPNMRTSAVAHGDRYLAVAVSNGTIFLYLRDSAESNATLSHGERVRILTFSSDDLYLASSGLRKVRIWDLQTQTQTWSFDVRHLPLSLAFIDENMSLVAATHGNYTISWDLQDDQNEEETWSWASSFQEALGQEKPVQPPGKALLSEDCSVLAVSYRAKPIYLFDMMTESLIGSCSRFSAGTAGSQYVVDGLAFNPSPEINVLVASYGDGELVVFDLWTAEPRYRGQDVFAHTLACSPDGRMLVTGSAKGTIQIFEFSGAQGTNLTLIYRIDSFEDGIHGVAFSNDSLRFTDIRRSQCRVWEPSVLISNDDDKGSQSELSQAVTLKPKSVGMLEGPPEAEITAICLHPSGNYMFCGKEDGTVTYFDVKGAAQREVLYQHAQNIRITCIAYCEKGGLLVTADESSRILVTAIKCSSTGCELLSRVADMRSDEPVLGLLVDNSGERLLAQGRGSARVWTTLGAKTNTKIILTHFGEGYTFFNHPFESDVFLVAGPKYPAVHPWNEESETIDTNENGARAIEVNEQLQPTLNSQPVKPIPSANLKSSNKLIATLSRSHSGSERDPQHKLMVWDASKISLNDEWPETITLPEFEHISANTRQIICVTGSVALFLDKDLWICSVDITRWVAERQGARRHFFLLSEWRGDTQDFLVKYVHTRREFLVVKKHDVLVVRRGLDVGTPL
ncbi:hypothetical protein FQN54_003094 [Arachnomyces sp. PD_36]|nr:hypothetical protein FQN54_003094 [Arachnomyces sp. PD_36]